MPIDSPFDNLTGIRSPFGRRRAQVPQAITVATTGSAGAIVFDPVAPLDGWTAITGNAGEIILEAA